ncbi:Chromatin modification-related protein eaf3 [Thelohanellus kitauei]|uniref:Chromatin modification-related protein eaf3 n=1 Tax=Thelohanellus kitauei TaxID=669202 RepID=A0A0C2N1F6_THEKT|nr:Chromatin modification-related protein eaf3 [Thelohanellus kitauei]
MEKRLSSTRTIRKEVPGAQQVKFATEFKLVIPNELKLYNSEMKELYISKNLNIELPKSVGKTIHDILNKYLESKLQNLNDENQNNADFTELEREDTGIKQLSSVEMTFYVEVTRAIQTYFNYLLPRCLLVEDENSVEPPDGIGKNEYDQAYGLEHLMRLFEVLPNYLVNTLRMNQNNSDKVANHMNEFLDWLSKSIDQFK